MAEDKKANSGAAEVQEATDIISSSIYGISPEFMRKNGKILDDTRRVLADKLSANRSGINGNVDSGKENQAVEFVKALTNGIRHQEKYDMLTSVKNSAKYTHPSGSHTISDTDDVIDKFSDSAAIDELLGEVQNHFSLMPEYSKVVDIIPELGKAVEMIVKDIINRDEFTQKYVTNFYIGEEDPDVRSEIEEEIKNLLAEYDFEDKIRRWIMTAEVTGVKPFSILPQDDVIHMINEEIRKRKDRGVSQESLIPNDISNLVTEESFLVKSPIASIYESFEGLSLKTMSLEGDELKQVQKSHKETLDPFIDSILTPDIIDQWEEICLTNVNEVFCDDKLSKADNAKDFSESLESMHQFIKKVKDPANRVTRTANLKDQLKDMVVAMDRSIEVVGRRDGSRYQASKLLKNNLYGNKDYEIERGVIEDFYRVGDDVGSASKSKRNDRQININGFEIDIDSNPIDGKEYAKAVKSKRAILTDYEPEHVIPISAGGSHIGYYVVEYIRTSGDNFMMLKKDRGSFLDIIRRIGVGEDSALTKNSGTTATDSNNPFSSGVFSPSTIMAPVVGGGPNVPNGKFGQGGNSNRKVELVKSILIKTITKRLGDEKLIDNGTFQSSLMNLIRDDILFRNNVRFTYIPTSHMVYMARELNSDGFPLSIFNGTLFTCYTYIASLISSLMMKVMKSSDVETMEVNVGKSKELGLTIGSISKNASTRNVSAKTLFGGTDQVVRSVGNFKRLIIPVIDGEKLFEVTQVERANNIDIDDEFTERNLKSIILKIGVPPTSLDMMSQDEYVASQTQHRLDYRNLIVDRGVNYSKHVTKAIRLLVHYSSISIPTVKVAGAGGAHDGEKDKVTKDKKTGVDEATKTTADKTAADKNVIDIEKIHFKFKAPKNLTVSKVTEELEAVNGVVDNIIKMYYGEDSREGDEWPALMIATRKLLIKHLSSSTDWADIDEVIETGRKEYVKLFNDLKKFNSSSIPDKDDPNPDATDADDSGGDFGGGDDSGGGSDDFGGGSDDFGGTSDFSETGDEEEGSGEPAEGEGEEGGEDTTVAEPDTSNDDAELKNWTT